jgi:hypothetical protein
MSSLPSASIPSDLLHDNHYSERLRQEASLFERFPEPKQYKQICTLGLGLQREPKPKVLLAKLGYPTIHIAHAAASINRGY